ncbi:MAG: hypothetical protein QMC67_00405 [Candidatus Wallbacteria bacterium]
MKKIIIVLYLTLILSASLSMNGCSGIFSGDNSGTPAPDLLAVYNSAITDAMTAETNEIYTGLTLINDTNSALIRKNDRIAVTTFMKPTYINSYKNARDTGDSLEIKFDCWVSAEPELKNFIKNTGLKDTDSVRLRAEQLLGLPPDNSYTYIVSFWVKPDDLKRPGFNDDITKQINELTMPANLNSTYKNWFYQNFYNSYMAPSKFPWTRLGYTYDWGSGARPHVGLTEFIIKNKYNSDANTNATVYVQGVYTISEYFGF